MCGEEPECPCDSGWEGDAVLGVLHEDLCSSGASWLISSLPEPLVFLP